MIFTSSATALGSRAKQWLARIKSEVKFLYRGNNEMNDQVTTPLRRPIAIGWYLLCGAVIFGFTASGGNCVSGGIVYCYGDARDYWWHPSKVIFSFVFALLLPLPNILLSMLFKAKRNVNSVVAIAKQWHRAFALFFGLLLLVGFLARLLQR